MKKSVLYICFLILWLTSPLFCYAVDQVANNAETTSSFLTFLKTQKSAGSLINGLSRTTENEFPENFPNENHEIVTTDIEETIEPLTIKLTPSLQLRALHQSKYLVINYNEIDHMQFLPDIVPPPPKEHITLA